MPLSPFGLLDALAAPAPDPARTAFLARQPYAHRGMHGGGIIENSRAAFSAAIAGGFGIELDVRMARDGAAMVFHDATLERLTDATGTVAEMRGDELARIALKGTAETIPMLVEILELIAGRVPLLIEIKAKHEPVGPLCLAVRRALEGYRGPVAVMSFNPDAGRWFRRHAPKRIRGLVVTEEQAQGIDARLRGGIARLISLFRARPDFLAYDIRDLPSGFAARQRKRGIKVLTWTVRGSQQEETAARHADEIIFEKVPAAP